MVGEVGSAEGHQEVEEDLEVPPEAHHEGDLVVEEHREVAAALVEVPQEEEEDSVVEDEDVVKSVSYSYQS